MSFLEKQMEKVRLENKEVKEELRESTNEYDDLYSEAQNFLKTSKDKNKINELLALLNE